MQQFLQKLGLAVPSLVLALTTVVTVPVFAQHGNADTNTATTTSTESTDDSTTATTSGDQATEVETLHGRGKAMVSELEKSHKPNATAAERMQKCEAHKKGLTQKFTHIVSNSQAFETKVTNIMTKATDYQKTNSVTVSNWDTLVTAATDAQTKATASITALQAVTPSIDCNSTSVAQDVATFKAAAEQVRDDLHSYKMAVKDLLVALENAKPSTTDTTTTTTTEGSNQ